MVSLLSLWLPILVAAVIVFVVSSIIHMATPFHKNDYKKLPNEDAAMDALRALNIPAGDYMAPKPGDMNEMKSPEWLAKRNKGPVFMLTMFPQGQFSMTSNLIGWFIYSIVVGIFAAYIASETLPSGTEYLRVHQIAGAVAFCGYGLALAQHSIWYRRNWGTTIRGMIDALIYGLVTGGTFGWLWPR